MSKRAALVFPAVLIALLVWAGSASAATISRSGTTVTYTAAPGETNNVTIAATPFGYRFTQVGGTLNSTDGAGGCLVGAPLTATCPISLGITSIAVNAGDGNDTIDASGVIAGAGFPALVGLKIDGGAGADSLTGGAGPDQFTTIDGTSDTIDCGPGSDSLEADPLPFDTAVGCEQQDRSHANVSVAGNRLVYTLVEGTSDLSVTVTKQSLNGPPSVRFNDPKAQLVAGNGCTQTTLFIVDCTNLAVSGAEVHTLDGDDSFRFTAPQPFLIDIPFEIDAGGGNDQVLGGNRADDVDAGPGNDTLVGNAGGDVLTGGPGDDLFMDGNDAGGGLDLDDFNGGADTDTYLTPTVPFSPSPGLIASLDGVRNDGVNTYSGVPTTSDNIGADIEVVIGSSKTDTLIGNDQPNTLIGLGDNDIVDGRGGDDLLLDSNFLVGQPGAGVNLIEGGDGDDLIAGGPITDQLNGGPGADRIAGFAGDDVIDGGDGDGDQLLGGPGADTFRGGAGSLDTVVDYAAASGPVSVSIDGAADDGPEGENDDVKGDVDVIVGSPFGDVLAGDDGAQTLDGAGGGDTLDGRGGPDRLLGRAGADRLDGGSGDDVLDGGSDGDSFDGGTGADTIGDAGGDAGGIDGLDFSGRVEAVHVSLDGAANDGASGGTEGDNVLPSVENLIGGQGDDLLQGTDAANLFTGGPGNDTLLGAGGDDHLSGSEEDDTIDGGAGADLTSGGAGEDRASYANRSAGVRVSSDDLADDGEPGEGDNIASDVEQLQGGSGNDTLIGGSAVNTLLGEGGDDKLFGGDNFDLLLGGSGNDELRGEAGPDTLKAGEGNDTADGGGDNDTVLGEAGGDVVVGGAGADNLNAGTGPDSILSKDGVVDIISCGTDSDPELLDTDTGDAISDDCAIPAVETSFVSLSITSVRASRSGSFTIVVGCRRIQQACVGTLSLETASKVKATRRGKKRRLALGSTKFNVAPGKSARLTIKLGKTARGALKRLKRFKVRATASGQASKSIQQTFTLSGPKTKKKGKR